MRSANRAITLRGSVCKPRIGVQDGKIEISQQRPLETILEKTRISSFWFTFTFDRPQNRRKMFFISSLGNLEGNQIPWLFRSYIIEWSFLGILTFLEFQKIPIWIFFLLPSKSVLSQLSILPILNGENPFLVPGFRYKNNIFEKEESFLCQPAK